LEPPNGGHLKNLLCREMLKKQPDIQNIGKKIGLPGVNRGDCLTGGNKTVSQDGTW